MQPTTIIQIVLATPKSAPDADVDAASWLLRAAVAFPDLHVLAFGAPGMRKDASLGRLFDQLTPQEGNRFRIELGAVLSERLPLAEERSEVALTVAEAHAENRVFCLSNVMQRLHYRKGETDRHALCPAFAVAQFLRDHETEFAGAPHVEYVPTVVTARYAIEGSDADEALSLYLENCVDDFIAGINRIVSATIVSIDPSKVGVLTPVYDRGSFPWVYLIIRGEGESLDAHRVATSLLRTTLVQRPLDAARWESFCAIVNGTRDIDVAVKSVRTAESYIQAGAYDFALLLAAIAAEVATTRYVHARLRQEGVSKTKLDNVEKDLSFSIMLNTQLTALAPAGKKPDAALLGEVDALRKFRNELMHEGTCALGRDRLKALVSAADAFVTYVVSLETS